MKSIGKALVVLFSLILTTNVHAQEKEKAAILHVLQIQENAWNKGDVDRFMGGYWHDDSLAFVGTKGVTYGWKNISANYKKAYPDTVSMGKLHFYILKVDVNKKSAFVIGKWHLTRSIGDVGGHFTLLFKKFGNHWFIVVDHTS